MTWSVEVDPDEWAKAPSLVKAALRRHAKKLQVAPHAVGEALHRKPKRFADAPNLYRCPALPDGWRALYVLDTLRPNERVVRIVFIGDHKEYDRLLGYKSR